MRARPGRSHGFTLVELLVALFALSLLAMLSWRGLDGMTRAQSQTQARSDEVLALQVALSQWTADLDALVQFPQFTSLDWNGRVLRLVRRGGAEGAPGVTVVGWTRRSINGAGTWLRWQSPALTTRGQVSEAWQKADIWSQNPGDEEIQREVAIAPLDNWQIFFFRGDAWTNPLSSDATGALPIPGQAVRTAVVPDGVRLELLLPAGQAIAGKITRDWVRPQVAGGKS